MRQLADPYGWHAFERRAKRQRAVHSAAVPCAQGQRTYSWNKVMGPDDAVTCRMCLYHMGRYVPLVKRREHQSYQRMRER